MADASNATVQKLTDDPRYQAAVALSARIAAKIATERATEAQLIDETRAEHVRRAGDHAIDDALDLLEGRTTAAPDSIAAKLADCRARLATLDAADRMQRLAIVTVTAELSAEAAKRARPAHVAAVRRVIDAVKALADANAAEGEARRTVELAGFDAGNLPNLAMPRIGTLDDPMSPARYWLASASHYCGLHDGSLEGAPKVTVRVLTPLPGHDVQPNDVVLMDAKTAHDLVHAGAVEPTTDKPRKAPPRAPLPSGDPNQSRAELAAGELVK